MAKTEKHKSGQREPDFVISVHCSRSLVNEDNIIGYSVRFGKMIFNDPGTRYPSSEGEGVSKEFVKGLAKLGELVELEAKNNPLITRP